MAMIYECISLLINLLEGKDYYIYHFDTSDQRKTQGYISHIALTTERYQVLP